MPRTSARLRTGIAFGAALAFGVSLGSAPPVARASQPPAPKSTVVQQGQRGRGLPPPTPTTNAVTARAVAEVELAADRLLYDRWYDVGLSKEPPLEQKLERKPNTGILFLESQVHSTTVPVRIAALRAIGRLQTPANLLLLTPALRDNDPAVRNAAIGAIDQCLYNVPNVQKDDPVAVAHAALLAAISLESHPGVTTELLTVVGDLLDEADIESTESLLLSKQSVAGLEALTRHYPSRRYTDGTVAFLRLAAIRGNLTAAEALVNLHDNDVATVTELLSYVCPPPASGPPVPECGWQLRRFATQMIVPANADFHNALETAWRDSAYQVRWESLQPRLRAAQNCLPIVDGLQDLSPQIVMRSLDLIRPTCNEQLELLGHVRDIYNNPREWQLLIHVLPAFAKISADDAKKAIKTAMQDERWQVRAAAAKAAGMISDDKTLLMLAADGDPNVRAAVLTALQAMKSDKLYTVTLQMLYDALDSRSFDVQLMQTAANTLKGITVDDVRKLAVTRLLGVLDGMSEGTDGGKDTSRDARVAILDRLKELAVSDDLTIHALTPYVVDFDPIVASHAADVLERLTLIRPDPKPRRRAPLQPTVDELMHLKQNADIMLEDGNAIPIIFNTGAAPIAVARFQELVKRGYYNGLTFHRVETNFVVQGGSPAANEDSGVSRYARDEITSDHRRGAIGLSTRGLDTADMQFFIDLVDLPRLDHLYTVFAMVVGNLDKEVGIDRILEGARISNIVLR